MNCKLFRFASCAALASAMVLSVSCEKDPLRKPGSVSRIVPVVKSVETRASQEDAGLSGKLVSQRVVSSADGFDLVEMVYENDGPLSDACNTRGEVVTTETLRDFNIDAYAEGQWHDNTIKDGDPGSLTQPNAAGLYFTAGCSGSNAAGWSLDKTTGPAREGTGGELYWLNNVPMTFWSYNIKQPVRSASDSRKASFEYTVKSDVSQQEDLLFAYSEETRKYHDDGDDYGTLQSQSSTSGASDENVNIWFYHALSSVQFLEKESLSEDYRISKIELQNIKNSTECEITATGNQPAAGSPNISFAHDLTGSSSVSFSQTYEANDASLDIPSGSSLFKPSDSKTFIMIPQTRTDSKLKVTFTYTGTPSSTTSPVFDFNGTWDAGYFYVYKIDLTGNVHVKILESCSSTVKSDVKFQNTSNVNEYVRAAVIANWYDASGNIVAAWDKTRDGGFTRGSGWDEGTDGFYYHTSPVATQATTSNLFDSFTKPTAAPVTGAHFEMTIMVQAVCSDGYSSCAAAF